MLCVTHHNNRDVAYEHATFNGVFPVIMECDKLLPYAVGLAPTIYDKIWIEATALYKTAIPVNLSLGLIIALGINYYCESRLAVRA